MPPFPRKVHMYKHNLAWVFGFLRHFENPGSILWYTLESEESYISAKDTLNIVWRIALFNTCIFWLSKAEFFHTYTALYRSCSQQLSFSPVFWALFPSQLPPHPHLGLWLIFRSFPKSLGSEPSSVHPISFCALVHASLCQASMAGGEYLGPGHSWGPYWVRAWSG